MQSFTFHNPTKIIFGNGRSAELGSLAKAIGNRALLVYGRESIKKSGLYQKICRQLDEQGIRIVEHGGVKPNPSLEHASKGARKALSYRVKFIIAVGGGSVIDEAKAIAAGAGSKTDIWDFFTQKAPITKALPLITVLTIPATGSEMNANMVITNEDTCEKLGMYDEHLYPQISILDPELTYTIPPRYTAYSAVDIISHLTESYFTNEGGWTPIQQRYVEGLVKSLIEAVERIMDNPEDNEARATMMWCATLGWNGLNTAGIGAYSMPCHTLEHPLSAMYDIAHGAGLSIITPAWLTLHLKDKKELIARFGKEVFGIQKEDDLQTAEETIRVLKSWYVKIGAPVSMKEAGIYAPNIQELIALAVKGAKLRKVPGLTERFIEKLYRSCI